MTNKLIDRLNYRIGLELGFAGTQPRFIWAWASDLFYYRRKGERLERYCWADRLGNVWLLGQWRSRPTYIDANGESHEITKEQWWTSFHGEFPYPTGLYYAQPETSLKPGLTPDENDTAKIIRHITGQMEKRYADHLREANARVASEDRKAENAFRDEADDWWPAFGALEAGKRGGHYSIGGI